MEHVLPAAKKEETMYTLQLPSRVDSINRLENFIESLREAYHIGEDTFANILVATTEAVNNAIMHGNKLDEKKTVYVNLEVENKTKLHFTIADEGTGFDYDSLPDPTLPENLEKPCGRGVFIMRQLSDQFIVNKKGTEIELLFKI